MTKYPVKTNSAQPRTAVRESRTGAVDVVSPVRPSGGFLSFRYSYTEISSSGDRTQVKANQVRLEDGKLSHEAFEGELGASAYDDMAQRAQQLVLGQTEWILRSLAAWLPRLPGVGSKGK
jgi:hypothetical protein